MRTWMIAVAALAAACSVSDEQRCDDDQRYDEENGLCVADSGTADTAATTDTATAEDTATADNDSATTADTATATDTAAATTDSGVAAGTPCTADGSECGAPADRCVVQPGATQGYCAPSDCTVAPDDCPEGFACCDMQATQERYCVTQGDFAILSGLGLCSQ